MADKDWPLSPSTARCPFTHHLVALTNVIHGEEGSGEAGVIGLDLEAGADRESIEGHRSTVLKCNLADFLRRPSDNQFVVSLHEAIAAIALHVEMRGSRVL